jgi:hypothetical protein
MSSASGNGIRLFLDLAEEAEPKLAGAEQAVAQRLEEERQPRAGLSGASPRSRIAPSLPCAALRNSGDARTPLGRTPVVCAGSGETGMKREHSSARNPECGGHSGLLPG